MKTSSVFFRVAAAALSAAFLITSASAGVLSPGNPITPGIPQQISGVGGTNAAGGAVTALNAFEASIGGVKNTAAAPQIGGFRVITWDGVAVDGTDFGGNTTVIVPNKVVGIPINRFLTQGAVFEEVYAVSADGFKSVSTAVNAANPALFPSFSPTRTFAMFNENTIGVDFAMAGPANQQPIPAAVRGFGAVFQNVRVANTTSISYYNGTQLLDTIFAPSSNTQGDSEFLGVLYSAPIVTSVQIVCGTDVIFNFNGTTATTVGTNNPPTHNLVATDDFVYSEPVPASNAQPTIAATAGTVFNATVATFADNDATATFHSFRGTIDWGDGFTSPTTFAANSGGGFNANASHTFTNPGTYPVTVQIEEFNGGSLTIDNTAVVTPANTKGIIVTGADKGSPPQVRVFRAGTGEKLFDFLAFEKKFKGGVRVAVGDVNGDGTPDIIAARGPGGKPEVRVFDGTTGQPFAGTLGSFLAYKKRFIGGVFVAAGKYDNDGLADIITTPGPGLPPEVKVFSGADGSTLDDFVVGDPKFKKGVSVAAADLNVDGVADIIIGAGKGGLPLVEAFDGKAPHTQLRSFSAFDSSFKGGVFVAAAQLDIDNVPDLIVGAGPGGGPQVKVFSGFDGSTLASFFAYGPGFAGGVRVAAGDLNGDGKADIVTGTGRGGGSQVNGYDGRSLAGLEFLFASDTVLPGGIWVAAGQ